jgi:uncharacterized protein (DUF2336 family)
MTDDKPPPVSRYLMLKGLGGATGSEQRRELLRAVTDAMATPTHSKAEMDELDAVLAQVAREYSVEVRTQFARLLAASASGFSRSAEAFANDVIEVAAPLLREARILSDEALLGVVARGSQPHMLAVSQRRAVSPRLSAALVDRGDDTVVTSLLGNAGAQIADETYEVVAKRAETSAALQGPLVARQGVPLDLLQGLYARVEADLKRQILEKFDQVPPGELEKAIERSRHRTTSQWRKMPADYAAAKNRVAALAARGALFDTALVPLQREGAAGRTAFILAFAGIVDVDFEVVARMVEGKDLDTLALLCRGAGFNRALFVTLAIGMDTSTRGTKRGEEFGRQYEDVTVQAAQRAMRFWKIRAGGAPPGA